jgi:hypothetical protein
MTKPVYILRTCSADGTSHGGFKWPKRGKVTDPNWDPKPECGNGLHGALWGIGNGYLFNWSYDALWQVVKVSGDIVDLGGKVKFESGYVVHTGDRASATAYIRKMGATGAIIGNVEAGGDCATVTGGYCANVTGGDGATVTGGDHATVTGGDYATLILKHHDGNRARTVVAYVGEDGIKPNTPYKLNVNGEFVEVQK